MQTVKSRGRSERELQLKAGMQVWQRQGAVLGHDRALAYCLGGQGVWVCWGATHGCAGDLGELPDFSEPHFHYLQNGKKSVCTP